MLSASTFAERRGFWAFVAGVISVTAGVLLHLPMFLMGQDMRYRLYGMTMGTDMHVGMALIIGGVAVTCYGLMHRYSSLPRRALSSPLPKTRSSQARIGV